MQTDLMSRQPETALDQSQSQHFMQRVSSIPLVEQSLNQLGAAYEATKNYSRVVKVIDSL